MATSDITHVQLPLPIEGETFLIPLTRGYVAIVDAIDADLVNVGWCASTPMKPHYSPYAQKTLPRVEWVDGKKIIIRLHRVVLERILGRKLLRYEECDHVDNNPLNDRRSNLRLATHQQNMRNRRLNINNTSGYKGVSLRDSKWRARIQVDGAGIEIGSFDTPEEAYCAYCDAVIRFHGEFGNSGE